MAKKSIIISSSGLKNIVLNKYQEEEDFIFVFGEQEFRIKSFFAEFISPVVSHLHQTDPTIDTINFGEIFSSNGSEFKDFSKSVLTPETISLLHQISNGHSIEISEEQAMKMRFISIILGNEELHLKLNELFPQKVTDKNVNTYLKSIQFCYNFSLFSPNFDFSSIISSIASHFHSLDKEIFLRLPRKIQYAIISNQKLRVKSENSLLDVVSQIIESTKEEEFNNIMFLEQIEFTRLSEDKFRKFINELDINEISSPLWRRLTECFFTHFNTNNTSNKHKKSKCKPKIVVGGYDECQLLGLVPNNVGKEGHLVVYPHEKSSLDPSSLLSYSAYYRHAVLVTSSGSLMGAGENSEGQISSSLIKERIMEFTEFTINDKNGVKLTPLSAVCSRYGTLYMFAKSSGIGRQLVYCDQEINGGNPVFLDIGNNQPVAIFGGYSNTAAITSEGDVIFINRHAMKKSPESTISAVSLPEGEKATSVACCEDSVFVLSSNNKVFSSVIERGSNLIKFSADKELEEKEIVCLSGTYKHCLAVTKEGIVFGRGPNSCGQLGIGNETKRLTVFTEISSLNGQEIKAAYAGLYHSLFETRGGKIFACGYNDYGQLLLNSGLNEGNVYSPTETMISGDSLFCIAGGFLSVVFIGGDPPQNTPNMRFIF